MTHRFFRSSLRQGGGGYAHTKWKKRCNFLSSSRNLTSLFFFFSVASGMSVYHFICFSCRGVRRKRKNDTTPPNKQGKKKTKPKKKNNAVGFLTNFTKSVFFTTSSTWFYVYPPPLPSLLSVSKTDSVGVGALVLRPSLGVITKLETQEWLVDKPAQKKTPKRQYSVQRAELEGKRGDQTSTKIRDAKSNRAS